jgi:hypothetical protein
MCRHCVYSFERSFVLGEQAVSFQLCTARGCHFGCLGCDVSIAALAFMRYRLSPPINAQEPPHIPPSIPLVGHLFGVVGSGARYNCTLHHRFPQLGLFGLRMLGGTTYIVGSADWANALEKRSNRTASN